MWKLFKSLYCHFLYAEVLSRSAIVDGEMIGIEVTFEVAVTLNAFKFDIMVCLKCTLAAVVTVVEIKVVRSCCNLSSLLSCIYFD